MGRRSRPPHDAITCESSNCVSLSLAGMGASDAQRLGIGRGKTGQDPVLRVRELDWPIARYRVHGGMNTTSACDLCTSLHLQVEPAEHGEEIV